MKRLALGWLAFLLVGCAASPGDLPVSRVKTPRPEPSPLPDLGPAPELTSEIWLNVDAPLRLADLRGRVVIVEMWTFGCINCQNVMPALRDWHARYSDQGLVIIGNHYPEFSYEADLDNLKDAVARFDLRYAVAQDNEGTTWRAYKNRYWPALFLIDKKGHIRFVHIGEGRYKQTEENIQALLAEEE